MRIKKGWQSRKGLVPKIFFHYIVKQIQPSLLTAESAKAFLCSLCFYFSLKCFIDSVSLAPAEIWSQVFGSRDDKSFMRKYTVWLAILYVLVRLR